MDFEIYFIKVMENTTNIDKPGTAEITGFIAIILIFFFFPYMMVSEQLKDIKADSYYARYKINK